MSLEIKVGPPHLAIHQGHTVLVSETDGQIKWPSTKGLYFFDTRLVSNWTVCANGEPWNLLSSGTTAYSTARICLANRSLVTEQGPIAPHTLGLTLDRHIEGGMREDFELTNYGQTEAHFNLEVALRCDFADIFEVRSGHIVRRGRITTDWSVERQCLTTIYRNHDFCRSLSVAARNNDSAAVYANGRMSFAIDLPPGGSWHSCLGYDLSDDERCFAAPPECRKGESRTKGDRPRVERQHRALKVDSSDDAFRRLIRQATDDLAALRLPVARGDCTPVVPTAGLPWFVALFGRDSLIASFQSLLVYPEFARGTLEALGSLQATERDDYRDAEPGKILHELRLGELAKLKLIPHTPYYGTADATPLYLITLHAAWCSTGDRDLLTRHLLVAERCLDWIDRYGDRDQDGFQEYATRSPAGLENQSWKDSGDALVYPDGSPVKGPKATCELQGYVYDAWQRMAEIYEVLGKVGRAAELHAKATTLFARFNETFWDEESGFYAFALDGDKNKVLSVASNPGHCLWSGIVPPNRAARVVARLMQADMWSGWGIRTLSADHPAYNPYSYQNGAVWPHDNGLIAQGFRRYGYADEANRIAHGVAAAGGYFVLDRLPELYAGLHREATGFPVQYLGANVPQAWAAGSVFSLLHTMLGLQPDAPHAMLYVDPILPAWLGDVTVRDLRIGEQVFDIRFWRSPEATHHEVLRGNAACVRHRKMAAGPSALSEQGGISSTMSKAPARATPRSSTMPNDKSMRASPNTQAVEASSPRRVPPAEPCAMVVFGAGGDMAKRLLIPALYNLSRTKVLPERFALIGVDLAEGTAKSWRDDLYEMLKTFVGNATAEFDIDRIDEAAWKRLAERMSYIQGDLTKPELYEKIRGTLDDVEKAHGTGGNAIFYLAVADRFFGAAVEQLGKAKLTDQGDDEKGKPRFWRRVVIEKPFGHSLDSARQLNARILRTLHEDQIFRIDHFLGKDTVQSIMAFRFANGLFEPIWNRDRIDHVQITVAETVGVEQRGKFYEQTGALRDMVPNHVFTLLSMVAMEPPTGFDAASIRTKKAEVFAAMPAVEPANAVRGQYGAGTVLGKPVNAYRNEPNVAADTNIETYVAMRLEIDNWRWAGVPFYFRTGKHMSRRLTEIAIRFKQAPYTAFQDTAVDALRPNWLVLSIAPGEGISLQFEVKRPGPVVDLAAVKMDFHYDDWFPKEPNVGYETLIYDVMIGDQTLFMRADMVEQSWRIVQPVLDAWAAEKTDFPNYDSGSDGSRAADELLARDGERAWRPVIPTMERKQ